MPPHVAIKNACMNEGPAKIYCENMQDVKKAVKLIQKYAPERFFNVYQLKTLPKGYILKKSKDHPFMIVILPKPKVEIKDGQTRIIKTTKRSIP